MALLPSVLHLGVSIALETNSEAWFIQTAGREGVCSSVTIIYHPRQVTTIKTQG